MIAIAMSILGLFYTSENVDDIHFCCERLFQAIVIRNNDGRCFNLSLAKRGHFFVQAQTGYSLFA